MLFRVGLLLLFRVGLLLLFRVGLLLLFRVGLLFFLSLFQGMLSLVCLDVEFPHPLNSRLLSIRKQLHRGAPKGGPQRGPQGGPQEGTLRMQQEEQTAEDAKTAAILKRVRFFRV